MDLSALGLVPALVMPGVFLVFVVGMVMLAMGATLLHRLRPAVESTRSAAPACSACATADASPTQAVLLREVSDWASSDRLVLADRMVAIGTLTGAVLHQINNPLGHVTTNLDYLRTALDADTTDEAIIEAVSDAHEAADRVAGLVRSIWDLTRPDDALVVSLDLHLALDQALDIASPAIRRHASLVRDYQGPQLVRANPVRLNQVVLNLLLNARQAIPPGSPSDHCITVRTRADDVGRAVVEVEDTGSGVPEGLRRRIFEPFFTTLPAGQGTGLGLYVSRRMVRELGGDLELADGEHRGARFVLTLPREERPGQS